MNYLDKKFILKDVKCRNAKIEDADDIATLYINEYSPSKGGDAREHYPFPQFLYAEWLTNAVIMDNLHWVVAEFNGQIIASAGAMRNIGNDRDCVAEVFGLVTHKKMQKLGVGRKLFCFLREKIERHASFIICESRTAMSAGWKISERCGFTPLGFEPFAHSTNIESESMLLTGDISKNAATSRVLNYSISSKIHKLASSVLDSFQLTVPEVVEIEKTYPIEKVSLKLLEQEFGLDKIKCFDGNLIENETVNSLYIEHNNEIGASFLEKWSNEKLSNSGVIGLNYLEGEDFEKKRYERHYYVIRNSDFVVGSVLVVLDKIDQRARILALQTFVEGLQGLLISSVVEAMNRFSDNKRLVLVVNITANALILQKTLEYLEFFPTVYYPSFVAIDDGRVDGVQYTRLFNCDFAESISKVDINWSLANKVILNVNGNVSSNC